MSTIAKKLAHRDCHGKIDEMTAVELVRAFLLAVGVLLYFGIASAIRRLTGRTDLAFGYGVPLSTKGYRAYDDSEYLTEEQVARFEERGFVGPFRLMGEEAAEAVGATIRAKVMDGRVIYGRYHDLDEARRSAKLAGLEESVVERGWFRHIDVPEMHRILTHPIIAKKVASLIGPDVVLWRSQCFESRPGSGGAGIHSASFLEGTVDGCLRPPGERHPSLLSVNAWVALTDANLENGCMRFVTGSHRTDLYTRVANIYLAFDLFFKHGARAAWELAGVIAIHLTKGGSTMHFAIGEFLQRRAMELERPGTSAEAESVPIKAGEFLLFTEATLHGSVPNVTADDTRLSLTGRYTTTDVRVYPKGRHVDDIHFLPQKVRISRDKLGVTLVHGKDEMGLNNHAKLAFPAGPEADLER